MIVLAGKDVMYYSMKHDLKAVYGGVLKEGYIQIIHFNGVFLYKPSISGVPPFMGKPYMYMI